MKTEISFVLDGKLTTLKFGSGAWSPTTTVLEYLRALPVHRGVKEGCAEGDCGACTVVLAEPDSNSGLSYRAVNSCLVFLPMLHGKQLITVENLKGRDGSLHPVQQAMVEYHGSQCGFCTPGIVMSIFALYKTLEKPGREDILDALTGNLCRCTGYLPIIEAAEAATRKRVPDQFDADSGHIRQMLAKIPNEDIHIQTGEQIYLRPATLESALHWRAEHPEVVLVNGATDVALRVTKNFETLPAVLDLSSVAELKSIRETDDAILIGPSVNISELMELSAVHFPALHQMYRVFGSRQIRELATIGGNLGTASPIGDSAPVLMAYNASLVLEGPAGRREVPLEDFFTGYRQTTLAGDELIRAVKLPRLQNGALVRAYKVSRRRDLDISTISSGFRLELDGDRVVKQVKLAYGGMAEITRRASTAEAYLTGKKWERRVVEKTAVLVDQDFNPISDVRGSAEFRRAAARNLLLKFWAETGSNDSVK